ncbi:Heat shock factor (HSF)-type, DNA-binding protein [Cordyceps fumosorosea ARSEF 2679]|uniref:Heat shock factor (HSF)-type, DNA-binding protein n=1 Tax=Cordyceps fumosorosea (strain ARSEF 2679) TaxID=1081104 RepID=A0A168BP52_CORFA|nr:Heat shock factor (HSF)-type, DNA-binding protein [Cordyceps fumosorosea ARSEF 2679]OAA70368.1 Heat shock factor (HSF)-type, DNA-binding protein [Cordyceps fumosorosea ARSEF 2679]
MSTPNSRKRAAPGASPAGPAQQNVQQPFTADNMSDAMTRWNGAADTSSFLDGSAYTGNPYGVLPNASQFQQPIPGPSNAVARRQMNQSLLPSRQFDGSGADPWGSFSEVDGSLVSHINGDSNPEEESVEKLEELAAKAKREATSRRKQIPPFVQKLSSFLEERKNEDFIRWSAKGDSFIVLDEDEFAKRLIPELFKHNNYASFVRQLNMYGFHKCVGLSDNSMRASERKFKSPSEYKNPYFRRGHPNLLWLINKPKGKKEATAKGASGQIGSDDDVDNEDGPGQPSTTGGNVPAGRTLPSTESAAPPKKEIAVIREELHKVREQQKLILGAINALQRNNHELYNQALMFQNQHDRHQNSINAILNFLANVFRKTLEDQSGSANVGDIITSMMSNQGQGGHGNVVDLGDFFRTQMDPTASHGGNMVKRTRGLLPPIPGQQSPTQSSQSPSVSNYQPSSAHNPEMGHVTELLDTETPPSLRQELESNPQERMMRIINDHNATSTPTALDPAAAELVANAPNTLNNDQRSQLVNFMAGQPSPGSSATPNSSLPPRRLSRTTQTPSASVTPQPDSASTRRPSPPSLSPIMRSPVMPVPSLSHIGANQEELDRLQRLQSDQDAKISELGELLGPLSPSGRIPGLDGSDGFFDAPNVDLDQYLNSDAFLHDISGDGSDFNFNLDPDAAPVTGAATAADGGQSKENTLSPTGTEEIQREDLASPTQGSKRQRKG